MADTQSRSFWSFLILVDALLLVAFGWALTNRLAALLEEPAVAAGPPTPVNLPKAKVAKDAMESVDVKDAEAKGPAPSPAASAITEPPPSPVAEEKPAKKDAAPAEKPKAPAPAAPAAGEKVRAKKVVFLYHNKQAKKVMIEGTFTKWDPKPMDKRPNGEWRFVVFLNPGVEYPYRFRVDGKELLDPLEPVVRWGKSHRKVD